MLLEDALARAAIDAVGEDGSAWGDDEAVDEGGNFASGLGHYVAQAGVGQRGQIHGDIRVGGVKDVDGSDADIAAAEAEASGIVPMGVKTCNVRDEATAALHHGVGSDAGNGGGARGNTEVTIRNFGAGGGCDGATAHGRECGNGNLHPGGGWAKQLDGTRGDCNAGTKIKYGGVVPGGVGTDQVDQKGLALNSAGAVWPVNQTDSGSADRDVKAAGFDLGARGEDNGAVPHACAWLDGDVGGSRGEAGHLESIDGDTRAEGHLGGRRGTGW